MYNRTDRSSTASGASFTPLALTPAGPASYTATDAEALASYLHVSRGWVRLPGRSPHELARLAYQGQLVIAYHSRTVLVQGKNQDKTHVLLRELVGASEPADDSLLFDNGGQIRSTLHTSHLTIRDRWEGEDNGPWMQEGGADE